MLRRQVPRQHYLCPAFAGTRVCVRPVAGAPGTLVHLGSTTARLAAVDVNNVYGIAHATVSRRRIESGLVCQVRPVALETMWRKAREREQAWVEILSLEVEDVAF